MDQTHLTALQRTRAAGQALAVADTARRRDWLNRLADRLEADRSAILAANAEDLEAASGLDAARQDRMRLDAGRLAEMARAVREVAAQPDPLAEKEDLGTRPSGIRVQRVRSPLGLVAMIYEARPNVTIDAAALAIYAGNAIVLRPGREIRATSQALGRAIAETLAEAGLPSDAALVLDDPERAWFKSLLAAAG
ncbi:MAG TPA: aldehyde dehydrogenase family protein, partial [Oscillatoriaceae cyanobacterium]